MNSKKNNQTGKAYPYYVFFDVDETLINVKSMFDFLKYFFQSEAGKISTLGTWKYFLFFYKLKILSKLGVDRSRINKLYYLAYKNKSWDHIKNCGSVWFQEKIDSKGFLKDTVIRELKEHKKNGAGIVLVSGSFSACLDPLKDYLEADYCLCTKLEIIDDICTGYVIQPQTIGKGKVEAIRLFLKQCGFSDLQSCFAYGDHISDVPMMEIVGNPVVVINTKEFEMYAKSRGWRMLS